MFLFCLVFVMSLCACICCLYVLCGHLLGKGWPLGSRLWCLLWVCHFPIGILGQVWSWLYRFLIFAPLLTLTIVKSDLGPNYLQKFSQTVSYILMSVTSLCQTVWVQIRPNNCQAWSGSKLFAKVSILHVLLTILSISSLPRIHDTSVNFEMQK